MNGPATPRALRVIAAYKLLKASLLLVVAATAFRLANAANLLAFSDWVLGLPIYRGHVLLVDTIDRLFALGPRKFIAIGIATCVYAGVFVVEGWGLWRGRRWAEYLTVIVTLSLIPIELYEIARHVTPLKIATLVVNLAIAAYLIVLLRRPR